MYGNNKTQKIDKQYLETAILLARMYGIAETLHPWDFLENDKFVQKMKDWTDEFLQIEKGDVLSFFERQVIE